MKKILLIPVGGTICCRMTPNGTLSVGKNMSSKLASNFIASGSCFADKVDFILCDDMGILSENMTVEKWNRILDVYYQNMNIDSYDGVIFAHGTDTLAYTAALFSIILRNTDIPVFIVSSNKPLDDVKANGNDNFRCAVECICSGITPNVYVSYKNISDGVMYLHLASRITQCENYSEDFYSVGMMSLSESLCDYSDFSMLACKYSVRSSFDSKVVLLPNVLVIMPYVGINYNAYNYDGYRAVLHGTYHSGTACVDTNNGNDTYGSSSILHMMDLCAMKNIDMYLAPSKTNGQVYDTVSCIAHHTVNGKRMHFIYGITKEMMYAKLLIAYSVFEDTDQIISFINTEQNYEYIYQ